MNVDALRHPFPVKQEDGAILLRENRPSASDVAVLRHPLNLLKVKKRDLCFFTALMPTGADGSRTYEIGVRIIRRHEDRDTVSV